MKKKTKTKKPVAKAAPKAAPKDKPGRAKAATIFASMVEAPIPYVRVVVRERVTEASMVSIFERVREEVSRHQAKRVLVDMREGSVALTISDMLGLAKMVAANFAGVLERFALLLRPQDVLSEKFFEPSVSSRGLPTFVSADAEDAAYWVSAKLKPAR